MFLPHIAWNSLSHGYVRVQCSVCDTCVSLVQRCSSEQRAQRQAQPRRRAWLKPHTPWVPFRPLICLVRHSVVGLCTAQVLRRRKWTGPLNNPGETCKSHRHRKKSATNLLFP